MGDTITRRRLFLGRGTEPKPTVAARPAGPIAAPAARVLATVSDACIEWAGTACRLCESWCEADAIRFRSLGLARADIRIDADRCNGCGACVAPCPAGAVALVAIPSAGPPAPVELRP